MALISIFKKKSHPINEPGMIYEMVKEGDRKFIVTADKRKGKK